MHRSDTILLPDISVHRLGFGAMRLAGRPEAARATSLGIARRAVELGVNFVDTADAYDLGGNEELLAEALYPYPTDLVIGTKTGQAHPGGEWIPLGRPEYLRQQVELSLRRLRLERIDLLQLHRIDPQLPLAEQIGTLQRLREEGKVRHVGLSEVSVSQLRAAEAITPIVSVQNRYNLADRASEPVLEYCEEHGIAFLPWLPIAPTVRSAFDNSSAEGPVAEVASRLGATSAQVCLAWLLHRSPVMLPIPGTSSLEHLEENVAAGELSLTEEEVRRIDEWSRGGPSR